jgi:hypothetical protein
MKTKTFRPIIFNIPAGDVKLAKSMAARMGWTVISTDLQEDEGNSEIVSSALSKCIEEARIDRLKNETVQVNPKNIWESIL